MGFGCISVVLFVHEICLADKNSNPDAIVGFHINGKLFEVKPSRVLKIGEDIASQ